MSITLAPATDPADLDAVRALCWDYRQTLYDNHPIDRELTETFYPEAKYRQLMDNLATEHARPTGIILLARTDEGQPVGCGMTHPLDAETAEIKRVFVSDAARGQGVAARICTALEEQAKTDGFHRVVLDTSINLPAAQRLYDRLGFRRRGPYQPVPDMALPHLVFFEKRLIP